MSFTEDLINGLGAHLAGGVPAITFKASGNYTDAEWGVYAITSPQNARAITIRPWSNADDPTLSDSEIDLQIEYRGGVLEVVRTMDAVFELLQGFGSGTLGPVKVQTITRSPGAPLGFDESGNFRHSDNYNLAVHRPSTNRQ